MACAAKTRQKQQIHEKMLSFDHLKTLIFFQKKEPFSFGLYVFAPLGLCAKTHMFSCWLKKEGLNAKAQSSKDAMNT